MSIVKLVISSVILIIATFNSTNYNCSCCWFNILIYNLWKFVYDWLYAGFWKVLGES